MARNGIASKTVPALPSCRTASRRITRSIWQMAGYGFLLGDGGLNYGRENIVESYYTAHVWRGIYVAPGVQHMNNPGYNRGRGPVLVPSLRAHVEF
jgi:carbohydrate-selective porin OprB